MYFRCKPVSFFCVNMYSMINTRQESPPLPNLADYAFGERLGAGSYGKDLNLDKFLFLMYYFI